MKPVDHTATTVPSPSHRAPSPDGPLLSRYADHASWFEGDERVTLYNWSDAGRRLDLINRALAVFVGESAAGRVAVNFDGDACFSAVGRAMLVSPTPKNPKPSPSPRRSSASADQPPASRRVVVRVAAAHPRTRGHLARRRRVRPRGVPGVFVLEQRRWILPPRCRGGVPGVPRRGRGVRGDGGRRADDDELDGSAPGLGSAVAAVLGAGGGAAAAAAIAWCAQNPGAAHVDVVERLARAKVKAANAEREAMGAWIFVATTRDGATISSPLVNDEATRPCACPTDRPGCPCSTMKYS